MAYCSQMRREMTPDVEHYRIERPPMVRKGLSKRYVRFRNHVSQIGRDESV